MSSFADLGVSRPVADALAKRGITAPFAVQKLVIDDVLDGHDVLVQSPTGSGKTLAFGVPLVDCIEPDDRLPGGADPRPDARARAADRRRAATRSPPPARSRSRPSTAASGSRRRPSKAARAHIVVATPGPARGPARPPRLQPRRDPDPRHRRGRPDARHGLQARRRPDRRARRRDDRQTLFFSATLEAAAGQVARAYTHEPRRHVHEPTIEDTGEVEHRFVHVEHTDKVDALVDELRDAERGRTLVFVRTKRGADRLVKRLAQKGVQAVAMHGDKSQNQRERALANFASGKVDTLVATDVAARGIDVEEITHVINFDAPGDRDAYVHRVGRSGRAGRDGAGISFVMPDQDGEMRKIAASLGLASEYEQTRPAHAGGSSSNGHSNGSRSNGNSQRRARTAAARAVAAAARR